MRKQESLVLCSAAALSLLASCNGSGGFKPRVVGTAPASTAEEAYQDARRNFTLANFGLALEGFRRAARLSPADPRALNGMAACYDRMGRFDLSRTYYERALALAPEDTKTLHNFQVSLMMQGKREEAAALAVPAERAPAHASATENAPLSTQEGETSDATRPLTPPKRQETIASATGNEIITIELGPPVPYIPTAQAGARLERLSLGEVELVTRRETTERKSTAGTQPVTAGRPDRTRAMAVAAATWLPKVIAALVPKADRQEPAAATDPAPSAAPEVARAEGESSAAGREDPKEDRASLPPKMVQAPLVGLAAARQPPAIAVRTATRTAQRAAVRPSVLVLNAAGRAGIAGRYGAYLRARGWTVRVGDAANRHPKSFILHRGASRRNATLLARRIPFAAPINPSRYPSSLILVLGRDAIAFDRRLKG